MSNTLLKIFVLSAFALFSFNTFSAPVNVNTADVQALASSLNGIGVKKAQAIIEYREAHGEFNTAMDLTAVKGIGEKIILKNQADIALTTSELANKLDKQNPKQ